MVSSAPLIASLAFSKRLSSPSSGGSFSTRPQAIDPETSRAIMMLASEMEPWTKRYSSGISLTAEPPVFLLHIHIFPRPDSAAQRGPYPVGGVPKRIPEKHGVRLHLSAGRPA